MNRRLRTMGGGFVVVQARWWVRAVATFFTEPRVEHVGVIEDLKADRGAIGGKPNYYLGVTYSARHLRLK